jgi:hypothetical protein
MTTYSFPDDYQNLTKEDLKPKVMEGKLEHILDEIPSNQVIQHQDLLLQTFLYPLGNDPSLDWAGSPDFIIIDPGMMLRGMPFETLFKLQFYSVGIREVLDKEATYPTYTGVMDTAKIIFFDYLSRKSEEREDLLRTIILN